MSQTTAIKANSVPTPPTHGTKAPGHSIIQETRSSNGSLYLNDIWRLAREKWEAAGRPNGDSSRFWLEAERELLQAPDGLPIASWIRPTK
jgi:hypothetical protein